jgi:DNA (cytosine-5)-methyltransferase 1
MKYGSVCSGIEAASVAWHSLGWDAQWYSEIEHFPSEVLKHRFPDVPNLGDMTQLTSNPTFNEKSIDLLVGGTPCQSFSVAGLRGGLADPRGNLMLTFLALADAKKPKWIVWENVPGVLSSNGGRDFGTFLGALGELGYGFAYRVLDAQHFGVAQRRRRVFVVGYLGDWRPAAAILFESESLQRDSKQSRAKRQETPTDAQGSVRATGFAGNVESQVAACLQTTCDDYSRADGFNTVIEQVAQPIAYSFDSLASNSMKSSNPHSGCREVETSKTIDTTTPEPSKNQGGIAIAQPITMEKIAGPIDASYYKGQGSRQGGEREFVAQPQYFESHPNDSRVTGPHDVGNTVSARYGTGGGNTPIVSQPIAVDTYNYTTNANVSQTLRSEKSDTEHIGAILHPIPVLAGEHPKKEVTIDVCPTLPAAMGMGGGHTPLVPHPIAVDCFNQTINEKTSQTIGSSASDVNHYGAVLEPTIIDRAAFNQGQNAQYEPRIEAGQTMSSLVAKGPHAVQHTMAIRRLTPVECEKLQGFPPNWTKIPYRNKPADQCPDGPRYKACGNSMAVPVMRWIGQRIEYVESLMKDL